MATQRITDRLVRELAAPSKGKQIIVRDDLVIGFAVRKTATGCTSFVVNYVCNGVERRYTIGSHPAWSVAGARDEAKRLRRLADIGNDPLIERRQIRAEPTLSELWDRYARDILPRKAERTQANERSMWKRLILPDLGRKRLRDIEAGDIDHLHNRISRKTPAQANRALSSVQHVFATAIRWRLISHNPAVGVQRNSEVGRERYLDTAETERLIAALDARGDTPSTLLIRFLLLTGARSGEALKATWDQFDLDLGVWTKPSSHTKQRRVHRVPLSDDALSVLQRVADLRRSEFVFPGARDGHLTTIKTVFTSICAEAGLANLRVHDLRHSAASFLVSDGASLPIIGRLLGHTQVATTNRYSHLADEPLRLAANQLARKVLSNGK
ncbi:Putative prophage CPS-53 integrase [Tsuneonella dongtanensis]|uniref:Putative prophage CPS-53 integrase n=1 Tax=Tsuneonella dongtanensis TaxID=692370 RepID=A0A1B2A9D3_9SPHN|nr:site-specific integrase [Tsuneonella dongtanensis]ANY18665.1 Putative prophage CPS-53 integrase [Tsuneonella dongtanensis]